MNSPKITKDNLECTEKWKELRDCDPNAYYYKEFVNWLVRKTATDMYENSEECQEEQLIIMGDFINDVHFSPRKYIDKYYWEWLREYVSDYYDLDKIARA